MEPKMSQPRSAFTFDRDFSHVRGAMFSSPRDPMPVSHAEHLRLIEAARAEAHALGLSEGRMLEADAENRAMIAALDVFSARLAASMQELARIEAMAKKDAVHFAMLFARKLCGRLVDQNPIQPIEATAHAIFNDVRGTPHLAVKVAPPLVERCTQSLSALMHQKGIEARLNVLPDPEIALGDCSIEWADGGILRNTEKLSAMLERAMTILLASDEDEETKLERRGA
jgi:flagellar assembly protein FliH